MYADLTKKEDKRSNHAQQDSPATDGAQWKGQARGLDYQQGSALLSPVQLKPGDGPAAPPPVTGTVYVNASKLNVRAQPDTSQAPVGQVSKGDQLKVTGASRGVWVQVVHQGQAAWVHGKYISPVTPKPQAPKPKTDSSETSTQSDSKEEPDVLEALMNALVPGIGALYKVFFGGGSSKGTDDGNKEAVQKPSEKTTQEPTKTQTTAPKSPSGAKLGGILTVVDSNALIRADGTYKSTSQKIPKGTQVFVVAMAKKYCQVISAPGQEWTAKESDKIWTSIGNLAAGGKDVGLGNERTRADAKAAAGAIKATLPTGRQPGKNKSSMRFSGNFATSYDGISLASTLLDKVMRMGQWAIHNDMVTGNISFSSGMRPPSVAHWASVAWHIQYDGKYNALKRVKALPGGKDKDGNTWYQSGWDLAQVRANANKKRSSTAIAAEGYKYGDQRRAPNPVASSEGLPSMGVSYHCSGGAIDVTFPWRQKGKPASSNATDVWGWDDILAQFGLYRPLPKGSKYQEYWHLKEKGGTTLDPDGSP